MSRRFMFLASALVALPVARGHGQEPGSQRVQGGTHVPGYGVKSGGIFGGTYGERVAGGTYVPGYGVISGTFDSAGVARGSTGASGSVGLPGYGFGYPTYGYPSYGNGSGIYEGIGMTAADQEALRIQRYALIAAQYQQMNAEEAAAYRAADLFRQQTVTELLSRTRQATPTDTARPAPIPIDRLIGPDGEVLWPAIAPQGGALGTRRQAAGQAIRAVFRDARRGEHVSPRHIASAWNRLADYADPAVEHLLRSRPDDVAGFVHVIQSLDHGLRSQARSLPGRAKAATPAPGGTNLDPDDAPKTGGDVLLESIKEQSDKRDKPPAPAEPRPDDAPKPVGEVREQAAPPGRSPSP